MIKTLVDMINTSVVISVVGLVIIVILLALAKKWAPDRWRWLKVTITPLALLLLGVGFGIMTESQRHADDENQKKGELLGQIITSHDRPDIAYLTAVGDRFVLHLRRYQNLREKKKDTEFDEYAAYFFYGMFRIGLVHFYATKGYALYPRLWMEQAFDNLAKKVIEEVQDKKETDPEPYLAKEEAALYKYFRPIYQTSKQEQTTKQHRGEPDEARVMLNFYNWLKEKETDASSKEFKEALQGGFKRCRDRLQDQKVVRTLIQIFEAITGLDDYAFNEVFAGWYNYNKGVEGGELKGEKKIPTTIWRDPPPVSFLHYPLLNFEEKNWQQERKDAWELIYCHVFTNFGGGRPIPGAPPIPPKKGEQPCPKS